MKAFRLVIYSPSLFINPRQRLRLASSSSYSSSAANPKFDEGRSAVYQHKLRFQRPTTIQWRENLGLLNSATFIGSVIHPLRVINTCDPCRFGVHTSLTVTNSPPSKLLSGHLCSYTKDDVNGNLRLQHELVVKELNYVAQHGQGPRSENHKEPQSVGGETGLEKYQQRLHLWQIFFANPYDWWDNRNTKLNTRKPDFKHKDTGEALWLSLDDPPWIKT